MFNGSHLGEFNFTEHWNVWLVAAMMIVAAVIDGWKLKVPNWITFPMVLSGLAYNIATGGWGGLWASLLGIVVGLAVLLPAYAIGGMGAGDVKLFAGVGAWVLADATFYAFCWSAIIGGILAVAMVVIRGAWTKHKNQFLMIFTEIVTIGNPSELSAIAADRKSSMFLLPYGIPLTIGTICYFAWTGML